MNGIKVSVYKNVLKKICDKYNGPEDFINEKIEEICSHGTLSVKGVIYILLAFLSIKLASSHEI